MSFDPPIQDIDVIDILGEHKDGAVDLAIVASGPLDGSPMTLMSLERKIRGYVSEVDSAHFRNEFNPSDDNPIRIVIYCEFEVSAQANQVIEALKPLAEQAGARLELCRTPVHED